MRVTLSHASPFLLVFAGILGFPWLVDPSPQSLPSSSLDVLPVSSSVSRFPLFIRTQPCWIKTYFNYLTLTNCIPGGTDGKEFACNAGDLGSIPG